MEVLGRLTGEWELTGQMGTARLQQAAAAEWLLDHRFIWEPGRQTWSFELTKEQEGKVRTFAPTWALWLYVGLIRKPVRIERT
jgi:hypothetical protein